MTGGSEIRRFTRPYDTQELDDTVRLRGGAILRGALSEALCARLCDEVDRWFEHRPGMREPTVRLPSIVGKLASAPEAILQPDLLGWAARMLAPMTGQVLLSSADYLERGPGDEAAVAVRGMHRGTRAWPHVPIGRHPVCVHAIVALVPFTPANGGMWLALDSQWLPDGEQPHPDTVVQAAMDRGDAVLLRSDLIHSAGANLTADQARRTLSVGYQVDWLRRAEDGTLELPPAAAADLPVELRQLLGSEQDAAMRAPS
jgi:hypothetical protein